ncbi:hypothetical protein FRB97_002257 [Tulasnella sp. 331]|nr:hypothetical protein FRB97_002257 [Tulasnella sp. 331]
MGVVNVVRRILLIIFSFIVLGILCHLTQLTDSVGFYYSSFALGIATALLSILVIVVGGIVNQFRRGAITSLVWFELAWTGLLWVLWLSTAAAITSLGIFSSCDYVNAGVEASCQEFQSVEAFVWLLWLFTFSWFCALLVMSIAAISRDATINVWHTPVTEHPFFHHDPNSRISKAPTKGLGALSTGYARA